MGKFSTAIVLGALAGVGYYVGKKVFDKKKAEKDSGAQPELFVEERHSTPKEKIQRASLFAVGAIKTGTEKIKEGLDEIVESDMVSKGESAVEDMKGFAREAKDKTVSFAKETKDKTVAFAKDKTTAIKDEIDNLKGMVSSINTGAGETADAEADIAGAADEIEETAEETEEEIFEEIGTAVTEAEEIAEEAVTEFGQDAAEAQDEISTAADEIDELKFDDSDSDAVDTFDFSSADKL